MVTKNVRSKCKTKIFFEQFFLNGPIYHDIRTTKLLNLLRKSQQSKVNSYNNLTIPSKRDTQRQIDTHRTDREGGGRGESGVVKQNLIRSPSYRCHFDKSQGTWHTLRNLTNGKNSTTHKMSSSIIGHLNYSKHRTRSVEVSQKLTNLVWWSFLPY